MQSKLSRAAVLLLVLCQLAAFVLFRFDFLRTGVTIVVVGVVTGFLALRAAGTLGPRQRRGLAISLGSSIVIVMALTGPSFFDMSRGLIPLLTGWSIPLAIQNWDAEPRPAIRTAGAWLPAVCLGAGVALWIAMRPPGPHPLGLDEALYLLQSQHVRHSPFMWPLDGDLAPFFLIRQTYSLHGYVNGQYPPGWPLVLSLASSLRASWVVLFVMFASLLGATYAFGRTVAGARVGALAAGFLAVNAFFLTISTEFLPHVFGAALALAAGSLMAATVDATPRRRAAAWAAAGLLFGCGVAVRPLTGITLAASLWLWVMLRRRPSFRVATVATAAACVGGLIPVALLMHYNVETTGALTRFGYDLAEHGLHALGFGMRGFVEYTNAGSPVERVAAFGPSDAVRNLRENLYSGLLDLWPMALIFPIGYLAARAGVVSRWRSVAAFAILPLAHFFYFYHFGADRFYFELLPFAMVGTAYLVYGLAQRRPAMGTALGILLVAAMLGDSVIAVENRPREFQQWTASSEIVERLRVEHPRLLVFVHSELPQPAANPELPIRWWGEPGMQPLYWYDVYGFPSDVIVARDLGARDSVLSRRFPGRYEVELSVLPGPPGGAPWVFAARPKAR